MSVELTYAATVTVVETLEDNVPAATATKAVRGLAAAGPARSQSIAANAAQAMTARTVTNVR